MKKGKVFSKVHITMLVMALALGAAVWLNMRFSSEKYLGEAAYVDNKSSSSAVQTAAKADTDRFKEAVSEREKAYKKAEELVRDTLDKESVSKEEKEQAVATVASLAGRLEKESNIETLLKAKGFEKAVAVIGDNNVTVLVSSDGVTTAQSMQIQDIVTSETGVALGNIKIVAVK